MAPKSIQWSPTGKARGTLTNAHVGRHSPSYAGTGRSHDGAFLHGQRPCLHAGVPAFDEALRAARCFGTQAWSPAAGMKYTLRF
jgi:hypothetical protein